MKKERCENFQLLGESEMRSIKGGGFIDTVRCVSGTVAHSFKNTAETVILGGTIWGIARLCGLYKGCQS